MMTFEPPRRRTTRCDACGADIPAVNPEGLCAECWRRKHPIPAQLDPGDPEHDDSTT